MEVRKSDGAVMQFCLSAVEPSMAETIILADNYFSATCNSKAC